MKLQSFWTHPETCSRKEFYLEMNREVSLEIILGFTNKTIKRLFPCDDSMVLVLDDRADVWEWSRNLIKVRPCILLFFMTRSLFSRYIVFISRFFNLYLGTGDINEPLKEDKKDLPPPPHEEIPIHPHPIPLNDSENHTLFQCVQNDNDSELLALIDVLKNVHEEFFKLLDHKLQPDVKVIGRFINRKFYQIVNKKYYKMYILLLVVSFH